MKIYTKTGDKGQTSLYDRTRVAKNSKRVESYGTIDELNAALGIARQYINDEKLVNLLIRIQTKLFDVGGELATSDYNTYRKPMTEDEISFLEDNIDFYMSTDKAKVFKFTLPGSNKESAHIHLARTICRRAERRILDLREEELVNDILIKYVNRLSDLLYAITLYLDENPTYINFD